MERNLFRARMFTRSFQLSPRQTSLSRVAAQTSQPRASYTRHPQQTPIRCFHSTHSHSEPSRAPKSRDRGPKSNEDTQTDFGAMDVLRNTAPPATSIDACTDDGFALNNDMRISRSGILLVGGEAFRWRPWLQESRKEGTLGDDGVGDDAMAGRLKNAKGQFDVPNEAWGVLELIFPKPDLLIIGTGLHITPIAPSVRTYLNDLGIRLDIQDTRNASSQFNLLATERGVSQVAAALIPMGWKKAS